MKYVSLFLIIFITLAACSNDVLKEEQSEVTGQEEYAGDEDTAADYDSEAASQNDYYDNSGDSGLSERPPKIKKISVEAVSNNLQDGLLAVVTTHDTENEDVNFIYQWKHNGVDIIGATEQKLSWNEEFRKGDTITLEIIPYDDLTEGIWKSEGSFTIPNSPPTIVSTPPATIDGTSLNYKIDADDLDGDELTYSLRDAPEGMTIDPDTGEINWEYSPGDAGEYNIGIEINDGDGGQIFQNMSVTVE